MSFIGYTVGFTVSLCLLMQNKTEAPGGPLLLADIYHYCSSSSESSGSFDEMYASDLHKELQGPEQPLQKNDNYSRLLKEMIAM